MESILFLLPHCDLFMCACSTFLARGMCPPNTSASSISTCNRSIVLLRRVLALALAGLEEQPENAVPFIKGSLDEKLPIYEQDPKSKRLDSFEKRFVRD